MSFCGYRNRVLPDIDNELPRHIPCPLLREAVREVERNVKAPRGLNLFAALAAITIPIQGLYDVRKPTGQIGPMTLMSLLLADSGERKSTVENVFFQSIREFQSDQFNVYTSDLKVWKAKLKIWDKKNKVILAAIGKLAANGEPTDAEEARLVEHDLLEPVKPKQFKILYEDATPEALFSGLHKDLSTAGLVSSEGGGMLNGRALSDLSKLNAVWSGDSISVERKTTVSFEIAGARLTTSIMAQKSAFDEYMNRCGEKSRGSGLWARFLVCYPESTQGTRTIKNETMHWDQCKKFSARITELLRQNVVLLNSPAHERQIVDFSPEAGELWLDVFNSIESETKEGKRFYGIGDHASKLADNIARVAALLHVFEGFSGGISMATLQFSIDFCLWCSDEFHNLFVLPEQEVADALELDNWLWRYREDGTDAIPKNYIRQHCPNKLREKNRLDRAFEELRRQRKLGFFWQGKKMWIDLFPK